MTALPIPSSPARARDAVAPSAAGRVRGGVVVPLAVATIAIGLASQVNYGQFHPAALRWLAVAIAACAAAVARSRRGARVSLGRSSATRAHDDVAATPAFRPGLLEDAQGSPDVQFARDATDATRDRRERLALAAGVAVQFAMLLARHPGVAELGPATSLWPFQLGAIGAAGAGLAAVIGSPRVRRMALPLLLLLHVSLGSWILLALPRPNVDVALFQRDACDALLRGQNPYAITFPDPSPAGTNFYGPGLSINGRLQFGYPYPPLSLLMALPAHALGDFRIAQLIAMTLAGALIAYARPGPRAAAAAALLLSTPRGFFVLQAGWTEPLVLLPLAAVLFLACRLRPRDGKRPPSSKDKQDASSDLAPSPAPVAPGGSGGSPESAHFAVAQTDVHASSRLSAILLPIALGLFLASKQYLVLALPALWLLLPVKNRARFVALAGLTGMLVSIPLAMWDVRAFAWSVALLQFHQPFRDDALSLLVAIRRSTGIAPGWLPFLLTAGAMALALRKCPRTPAGFALAIALTFLVFFAFGKQAFCNYYHFVIGTLCCAIAAMPCERERPIEPAPQS